MMRLASQKPEAHIAACLGLGGQAAPRADVAPVQRAVARFDLLWAHIAAAVGRACLGLQLKLSVRGAAQHHLHGGVVVLCAPPGPATHANDDTMRSTNHGLAGAGLARKPSHALCGCWTWPPD